MSAGSKHERVGRASARGHWAVGSMKGVLMGGGREVLVKSKGIERERSFPTLTERHRSMNPNNESKSFSLFRTPQKTQTITLSRLHLHNPPKKHTHTHTHNANRLELTQFPQKKTRNNRISVRKNHVNHVRCTIQKFTDNLLVIISLYFLWFLETRKRFGW